MDKQIAQYIRKHIVFVIMVVVVGFLVLAAGEYYLYRQIMYLNKMISEGFMQVKSAQVLDEQDVMEEEKGADSMMSDEYDEVMKK